ncbi:hypothetical protein [Flavobacterium poyangense]|uniref:hypothetical protein n=1 Tax=Flavobacterium poyangense TaxID=2204302 RepID=UPI0014231599|nr:hypothetical protein [Flavobacterium sp. JXAS1]
MSYSKKENSENIKVLELRNYLLKPNFTDSFHRYFHLNFVDSMNKLGGYTVGEFKIKNVNDRFVWLRGFTDMHSRAQFLNDFYINSPVWKEHGKGANEMMINSDHVYLLRPLYESGSLNSDKEITVVNFYICNCTVDKVIKLFEESYIPFLKTLAVEDFSLWTSEMTENDFPRLPVFQDKNLLVLITNYKDENERQIKEDLINKMPEGLKMEILELVKIQTDLTLINLNFS